MFMSKTKDNAAKETLLVYLPCHTDYRLAMDQASRIREIEKNFSHELDLEILVMISCNGAELADVEIREIARTTNFSIIFPFGISGDVNITQGFMHAVSLKADYLWILSSNDKVASSSIHSISEYLVQKKQANILVGCPKGKPEFRKINSVFDKSNQDMPLGLISSVVYRTKGMANNFDSAAQMNWTGWGQLAAIEASCIALNGIIVSIIDESSLHQRSMQTLENPKAEKNRVRKTYTHSFFGMPIVINALYSGDPKTKRKYLNDWIGSNWYLINYFMGVDLHLKKLHLASNQIWLRQLSFRALRNSSIRYRIILFISMRINFDSIANVKIAQFIHKKIKF